jgi:ATP-dependent HslUV protease ATP-binding subunit HslU
MVEDTPSSPEEAAELSPRRVVEELDRFIIGQNAAKRAVAVALRNRWRRKRVQGDLRDEISPKNIILIGPTGVGKTEIARRLARLTGAPFLKVEATKFTEVGYVGKDVESMIRDLVEQAVRLVRDEMQAAVQEKAREHAARKILDALLPDGGEARQGTRDKLLILLDRGALDDREVEIEVTQEAKSAPGIHFLGGGGSGMDSLGTGLQDMLKGILPKQTSKRKVTVADARRILGEQEAQGLVDQEQVVAEALRRVQEDGIVFIDEIDKIAASSEGGAKGPDVSRQGVQRDILPIVEGTTVHTRHGQVKTDHILFVAAGAFHVATPSDLIPELQGRFPIRVELQALGEEELRRILVEPKAALVRQYIAMMATEGVDLEFTDSAVARIAAMAAQVNERDEDIGARRLHTMMEALLEELSFVAPERGGDPFTVNEALVEERLAPILGDRDLARYIL